MTRNNGTPLEALSRQFSYALRHNPGQYGLTAARDGSVDLNEFVAALSTDLETVQTIVNDDTKGRYAIDDNRIRAVQGHSFPVDLGLEEVERPGVLYHGTKVHHLGGIKHYGLIPGNRHQVHLSPTVDTASAVARRRSGNSALLSIDGNALVQAGYPVFRAENGVLLTDLVPWTFVVWVEYI